MFQRLFAMAGLSLDRLRALVEVGAAGSLVRAAAGDPIRQSQLSRQIKELEDFFQVHLTERQGRGLRLTAEGRELARISRFFLLGLSNFQRGRLAEGQQFRLGGPPSFLAGVAVPALLAPAAARVKHDHALEAVQGQEVERRLHDLTLDFGVVHQAELSRPLQTAHLGTCQLFLCLPKSQPERRGRRTAAEVGLSFAVADQEWAMDLGPDGWPFARQSVVCGSFLEARAALETGRVGTVLPGYLVPRGSRVEYRVTESAAGCLDYYLAWNPRLLRLNPHAVNERDRLVTALGRFLRSAKSWETEN